MCVYLDDDIAQAKRERRKLERKWRRTKSDVDHQRFTAQCVVVNDLVKDAKEKHFAAIIESNKGNQKVLFSCIDKLLNRKPTVLYPHSSSDEALAKSFIEFFTSKINTIRQSLPAVNIPMVYMRTRQTVDCELKSFLPISVNEASSIVGSMKLKSCTLDPIPSCILKDCLPTLLPVITEIVNLSLSSGTVPHALKTALVFPLLKKPNLSHEDFKNFRPVSNLPFISNVIEKTVASQLVSYMDSNNLHIPLQSAYKKTTQYRDGLIKG